MALRGKDSFSYTYSLTFDESYSISVQESHSSSSSIVIENHRENSNSTNFSSSISDVIETAVVNTSSNDDTTTWDESFMKDITNTNEKHSEDNWNHEKNSSTTSGTNESTDNGTNWGNSFTNSFSLSSSNEETKTKSIEGNANVSVFGIGAGVSTSSQTSTSSSSSSEINSSSTSDFGGSFSKTSGTTTDNTTGKSDSTGGSKGPSDSVSVSEQSTRNNGGSRTTSNAIERSSSSSKTTESSNGGEIGFTYGESKSTDSGSTDENSRSKSYSFTVETTINGPDDEEICEVAIYKKVKRYNQITSCYDKDDENNFSKNTRSLIHIDIDVTAVTNINKMLFSDEHDSDSIKAEGNFLSSCVNNIDQSSFLRQQNRFVTLLDEINDKTLSYYSALITGMELKGNIEITDRNPLNSILKSYALRIYNDGGNIKFGRGNSIFYNTETGGISNNAIFKISEKNHLQVFVEKNEELFKPVGIYGEEFKDENYYDDSNKSFINFDLKLDPTSIINIEEEKDDDDQLGKIYLKHFDDDNMDYDLFMNQSEEDCKLIFKYCNLNKYRDSDIFIDFYLYLLDNKPDLEVTLTKNKICKDYETYDYNYSEDEINYLCNPENEAFKHKVKYNDSSSEICDCKIFNECSNDILDVNSIVGKTTEKAKCKVILNNSECQKQCKKLYRRNSFNDLTDFVHLIYLCYEYILAFCFLSFYRVQRSHKFHCYYYNEKYLNLIHSYCIT
ncbi:hypothetical protein BCR36DRAFT_414498 [Piromyces finnis]|uniref:Uncharacterized protein n=1 Tax=Piromyces finnis TaxID=1754191 RepID=A0A1Y1V3J3_9FUNG|nr:hypothetical protein BCR36DRAFT_414498 [Piromyces finnis]|eukprot:ORX45644.1 hypothetical protein BCR36DRAFT_414498 [Piromyces finnis]